MRAYITKRVGKRGTTWYGRIDLPPDAATGKRRQKRFNAPTKREVEAKATELLAAIARGGFAEADASKITVVEYLERWLSSVEGNLRPSSHRRYTEVVGHINKTLGKVLLGKLAPLDVQRLYKALEAAGQSPTSVNLAHNVLHRALKQAMRWGLLTRNVTEAVDPPRRSVPAYSVWSEPQVAAFLAIAERDEWAALWRLALLTGMRRGELLGLMWSDVDLAKGVLSVRRTLSRGTKGAYTFGSPKTAAGRRSIALPASAVECLKKHRLAQVERRLRLKKSYLDQDLIFTNEIGEPLHPNTVANRFLQLSHEAGVPRIRLHDMRHTSATLMLANNVHPKVVQERLGHANISMTLDRYSHVSMDMQRDAADQLDLLLGRAG